MSDVLDRPPVFVPSIAQGLGAGVQIVGTGAVGGHVNAAIWALSFGSLCAPPRSPISVAIGFLQSAPVAAGRFYFHMTGKGLPLLAPPTARLMASGQEMVGGLKLKILDVERKTIYSWLDDGIEANAVNYERLRAVHDLLGGEKIGSLRFYHRFWERKLSDGACLKDLLTAAKIDERRVCEALATLRPTVDRAMQADLERKSAVAGKAPASLSTLRLRAG